MEIIPEKLSVGGAKHKRVAKYSDIGLITYQRLYLGIAVKEEVSE